MKRDEWTFAYTASKLAEASTHKREHHLSRRDWWEKQKENVMAKVRDNGIEVHDGVANLHSNTTRGCGPQIVIDPMLQRDLSECQSKITEHDSLIRQYEGWKQVLQAQPESRLEIDHDDFLFFFGV